MTEQEITEALEELSVAISKIDDPHVINSFLHCLLTDSEINEVTSRWSLVRKIKDGDTQRAIAKELGLSLCKITRGSKELKKEDSAFRRVIEIFEDSI